MRPDIDGLVVTLEQRQEVIAPILVKWPVACFHITLPEIMRDVCISDRVRHRWCSFSEHLGNLPDLLQADEQSPNSLHHNGRHDCQEEVDH